MNLREAFFAFAAVLVMLAMVANPAIAQVALGGAGSGAAQAGGNVLNTFVGLLTGNIGTVIGLFVVVLGLWTWIIKQETGAGIIMIIGGVVITLVPQLFTGTRNFMEGILNNFAGGR
jgi:type IV secretory pathway VirB2 component (pilin)